MHARVVRPELLDELPAETPAAQASRRDLWAFNRLMRNDRWFAQALARHGTAGERILEIGAGSGELAGALADWSIDGLDRCPRPAAWRSAAHWHQVDLFAFEAWQDYPVVMGNLVFHHFDTAAMRELGRRLDRHARLILASEPARQRRFAWLYPFVCAWVRAHPVSRYDGAVSIRAGFRGDELPQMLGLSAERWRWRCEHSHRGAYRLIAERCP
jgi:2-polyprenyl-3-methyl-5-hydroxy-6-metoxy-1,4-benzoquinol methylase